MVRRTTKMKITPPSVPPLYENTRTKYYLTVPQKGVGKKVTKNEKMVAKM